MFLLSEIRLVFCTSWLPMIDTAVWLLSLQLARTLFIHNTNGWILTHLSFVHSLDFLWVTVSCCYLQCQYIKRLRYISFCCLCCQGLCEYITNSCYDHLTFAALRTLVTLSRSEAVDFLSCDRGTVQINIILTIICKAWYAGKQKAWFCGKWKSWV